MPSADVETLGRIYAEWAKGRFWSFDLFHRDVEARWATEVPDIEGSKGIEGLGRLFSEWVGAWEECRIEAEEYHEGAGVVVVFVLMSGRGSGSSIDVQMRNAHVWTMRDGQAVSIRAYTDRERALRETGLAY
jgi:ketosteroid isomerase-like protein